MSFIQGVEVLKFNWYLHRLPIVTANVTMGDKVWIEPSTSRFALTPINPTIKRPSLDGLLWGYATHDAKAGDEIAACFSLADRLPMVIIQEYGPKQRLTVPTEPYAPGRARWFLVELSYALVLDRVLNYSASKVNAKGFPYSDTSMPVQQFYAFMKGLEASG